MAIWPQHSRTVSAPLWSWASGTWTCRRTIPFELLGTQRDDYRIRGPETEILLLRWFDEQYANLVGDPIVRSRLVTTYPASNIVTTLDSKSPQLVEQRLYAAIRLTQLCVADWTASRPSVFFESGVRLAVSEHHPIFIICDQTPKRWMAGNGHAPWPVAEDPWIAPLATLFGLTRFSPGNHVPFVERIKAYEGDRKRSAGGCLSPGRTYAVACEAIDRAKEPGGLTVESFLLKQADRLAGEDVSEGDVPVLYGSALTEQVRTAAVEHLLAARDALPQSVQGSRSTGRGTPRRRRFAVEGTRVAAGSRRADRCEAECTPSEHADGRFQVIPRASERRPRPNMGLSRGSGAKGSLTMDVIARARDLKTRAMDQRDRGKWTRALMLLDEAKASLQVALDELPSDPSKGDSKLLEFENAVKKSLYGMWGSIGGVYRRRAATPEGEPDDLKKSVESYDKGRQIEKGFVDSYNLTQRLITRVLLSPSAAVDDSMTVENENVPHALREARQIVWSRRARPCPRNKDEYAFADAAIIALILGERGWTDVLNEFLRRAPKSSYARNVTLDVLKELAAGVTSSEGEVGALRSRIDEALGLASVRQPRRPRISAPSNRLGIVYSFHTTGTRGSGR